MKIKTLKKKEEARAASQTSRWQLREWECIKEEVHRFWPVPLQGTHSIYTTFMKATGIMERIRTLGPDRSKIKSGLYYLLAL